MCKDGSIAERFLECIEWIGSQPECRRINGVLAAESRTKQGMRLKTFCDVVGVLYPSEVEVWRDRSELIRVLRDLLIDTRDTTEILSMVRKFAVNYDIDIQSFFGGWDNRDRIDASARADIEQIQQEQMHRWTPFRMLASSNRNIDLSMKLEWAGLSGSGANLLFCSSFCDNVKTLDALARQFPLAVYQLDRSGRSLEIVANANESKAVVSWVETRAAGVRLSTLIAAQYRRQQAVKEKILILNRVRGPAVALEGPRSKEKVHSHHRSKKEPAQALSTVMGTTSCGSTASANRRFLGILSSETGFNLAKNAEHMIQYGETFRQLDEAAQEFYESDKEEENEEASERFDP